MREYEINPEFITEHYKYSDMKEILGEELYKFLMTMPEKRRLKLLKTALKVRDEAIKNGSFMAFGRWKK